MFKKNSIKILLIMSIAIPTFYSNINAMNDNKNSIAELNTINKPSQNKNNEEKNFKESNNNINLKKSQSASNFKCLNISLDEPKKTNKNSNRNYDIDKIDKEHEFKLNEHNDFINKIVEREKEEKLKEEKEKEKNELLNLHYFLTNLIKKFDEHLEITIKISNRYKNLIYNVDIQMQQLEDMANFSRHPMYRQAIEEADKLHIRTDFNIYKVTSDLLNNIDNMKNLIVELEKKYNEYVNLIKNVKYKQTLEFYFNHYDYNSLNAIIFNKDIDILKNKIQEILDSITFPTHTEITTILQKNNQEKTNEDKAKLEKYVRKFDYINSINNLEDKKLFKYIDITKNFKKQIKIRKKILPHIQKIVEADVIENMEKKVLDLVDEEYKMRKKYSLNKDQWI